MIVPFDGYVETLGKVSSTCLVTFDRNRYSAPCELVGQMVGIRVYPERIDLVAHDAVVASHLRSFGRTETRYDWQHYIPLVERKPGALRNGAPFADLPAAMQKLRGCLLKREGGDRIMAKVLAAVPKHGLEAVLVAVELVLESDKAITYPPVQFYEAGSVFPDRQRTLGAPSGYRLRIPTRYRASASGRATRREPA